MSRQYRSKYQARVYWQEVIHQWQQSGLSASQFCRRHQISDSGFYTWRKKLAATSPVTRPNPAKTTDSPFIQVDMQHPAPQSPLSLHLASGHTLHMTPPVNTDALVKVIHALQDAKLC